MKKVFTSIAILIGASMFLCAQISNSHVLTHSDLTIQHESMATGISVNATQQQLNSCCYLFPAQPPHALNSENPPLFTEPNAASQYATSKQNGINNIGRIYTGVSHNISGSISSSTQGNLFTKFQL